MPERRVAKVVSETDSGNDGFYVGLVLFEFWMFIRKFFNSTARNGTPHASHLETMGESVVNHLGAWQGKNLSLVLKPAKSAAENDAVIITLE